MKVLVPIRYPLTRDSERTLREALEIAREKEGSMIVLHVDLFYDRRGVTATDLRKEVRRVLGELPEAAYVVKEGLLVEETILEEAIKRAVDVLVIGKKHSTKWRRMMDRVLAKPDVERFLGEEWDGEIRVVD